jgi:alpha-beta hydrolase superfamily lysophospholipase
MTRKKALRYLKLTLLTYALIGIFIYFSQDYIILRPAKLPPDYKFKFDFPFRELNIPYDANTNINIIQFSVPDSVPRGVVLYFHGNRANVSRYRRFAPYFTAAGYEVWMIDYPGYGKSTGVFSEKLVYEWAGVMYKLARARFQPNQIIIYGKSLGTGIAAQLASVRNCQYLILETPYYSMPEVIGFYAPIYPTDRLIRHQFPTYTYLPRVADPVIIMHGTNDWVVRYKNSVKLSQFLKKTDKLVTVQGGTHNNLYRFPQIPQLIDSLLKR